MLYTSYVVESVVLGVADVTRLLNERSPTAKIDVLQKVVKFCETEDVSVSESQIAEEIFGLLANDAQVVVRKALSDALKGNPTLPHHTAMTIAQDISIVAVPFVLVNKALNQADLTELAKKQSPAVQIAIAKRDDLTAPVSHALVRHGTKQVVETVMKNEASEVHERTFYLALQNFGHDADIAHSMAMRSLIPVSIAEELISLVSDSLKLSLAKKYNLSEDIIAQTVLETRDKATLALLTPSTSIEDILELVAQLNKQNRLTDTIIISALERGDLLFFEAALSELSGVLFENVQALVRDRGTMGLLAIYRKAGLDDTHYQSVRLCVDMAYNIKPDRIDSAYNFSGSSLKDSGDRHDDDNDSFEDDGGWTDLTS